jgi:HAD superfamily phosphatase (TIGR01668 family)
LEQNKRAIIFDLDNTLAPYYESEPSQKLVLFLKYLVNSGFRLCILSNNKKERVDIFNKNLELIAIHGADKPLFKGMNLAITKLGVGTNELVVIGDQIFTDILVGNRKNAYTILVNPLSDKEEIGVRIKRKLEALIIKSYLRSIAKC